MSKEYINLSDLKKNYVNKNYDEENEGYPIYQIQPDKKGSYIIQVGRVENVHDILINKFDISEVEKCIITSSIYKLEDLKELESKCSFPLIKIIVNHNNNNKLYPVGCMILFFHTFDHIKEKEGIEKYISNKDNLMLLNGFFSISFHFKENKLVLENLKDNIGMKKMIDKMIEYLTTDKIRNIIESLFINMQ